MEDDARAAAPMTPERAWWLRTLLVLQRPAPVFAALRDDSAEDVQARQEPVLAIVLLAGIAGVLSTRFAGRLLDESALDAVEVALWTFVGGAFYGFAGYFVLGFLLFAGAAAAGSLQTYRRARHLLALAAVPLALSLAVWPVRLSAHGLDSFRAGGSDTGAAAALFEALELAFLGWAVALLVVGLRAVHAWSWPRAAAAAALPALVPALALARAYGLL